jgi:hypothetical protein
VEVFANAIEGRFRTIKWAVLAMLLGLHHPRTMWLLIALLTGGACIMCFRDPPTVAGVLVTGRTGLGVCFFSSLFTATT